MKEFIDLLLTPDFLEECRGMMQSANFKNCQFFSPEEMDEFVYDWAKQCAISILKDIFFVNIDEAEKNEF